MIEEDLIAYCTTELQAFCGEEDGLQEVHSAGVVHACESVLRTENLMEAAFHDTLMLLATLCTNDEVRRSPAINLRRPVHQACHDQTWEGSCSDLITPQPRSVSLLLC